ncbi:MAG TPA: class I SAM-dependent methyltransferase [Ktedonobacteraceae bacterium]|jgi:ubiquinone/menaquinone biosynthesis C-methylase UbiE
MPPVSFDPVAHIYDATRGYPDTIAQRIAQTIDTSVQAVQQTALLEIGVGTGRIAYPLALLGRTCTGVDISEEMLTVFEEKLRTASWQEHGNDLLPWGSFIDEDTAYSPLISRFTSANPPASIRLVCADIEHLPLSNASFDVVIAVHIFHLLTGWQEVIKEVLRVLRPGGWFLHCWDDHQNSDRQLITRQWRGFVQELGGQTKRPGASSSTIKQWLETLGLEPETDCILTWKQSVVPRAIIETIAQRIWSSSWTIPDDIFDKSIECLWQWANDYYGADIDNERTQEHYFVISKTRV